MRSTKARPGDIVAVAIDGRAVRPDRAVLPIDDWGFRYGWGAFETIRLHRGVPLFLDRHLRRLAETATVMRLPKAKHQTFRREPILDFLRRRRLSEGVLNLYWTHGSPHDRSGRQIICLRTRKPHRRGRLRLWVAPWRIEPTSPGIGFKTLAHFPYAVAADFARQNGCDEALLLNTKNRVADGATSSIFLVENGRLLTPPTSEGALAGITRGIVLEIAAEMGVVARIAPVRWDRLLRAEAVFVTSALRGIAAVAEVAGHRKLPTREHSLVRQLNTAYRRRIQAEIVSP